MQFTSGTPPEEARLRVVPGLDAERMLADLAAAQLLVASLESEAGGD